MGERTLIERLREHRGYRDSITLRDEAASALEALKRERDDYKSDYLRRHKDVGDEMEKRLVVEAERNTIVAERDALRARVDGLEAALTGGLRKLRTYQGVYPGDKELRRLLAEWQSVLSAKSKLPKDGED